MVGESARSGAVALAARGGEGLGASRGECLGLCPGFGFGARVRSGVREGVPLIRFQPHPRALGFALGARPLESKVPPCRSALFRDLLHGAIRERRQLRRLSKCGRRFARCWAGRRHRAGFRAWSLRSVHARGGREQLRLRLPWCILQLRAAADAEAGVGGEVEMPLMLGIA
jgi:hypothetical protein